jgi:hypothetical protein
MSKQTLNIDNKIVVSYLNKLWSTTKVPEEQKEKPEEKKENTEKKPIIESFENVSNEEVENILIIPKIEIPEDDVIDDKKEKDLLDMNVDLTDKDKFRTTIQDNLKNLRNLGFRAYRITLEDVVNLKVESVSDNDINKVHDFKVANELKRKDLMGDISACTIFEKYKSGDVDDPSNYRYLVNHHNTIKILDRLWCLDIVKNLGENLPDPDIFITSLIKTFNSKCIMAANRNTMSIDNVILLDIEKAYDSFDWDVTEELLRANLTRKVNKVFADRIVNEYMTILKNRNLYFRGNIVTVSKGIPTGLPSSQLVITLALEEIVFRFLKKTDYKVGVDMILNIYVDDFYIKLLKGDTNIVHSLINYLESYKLFISRKKSKADPKLNMLQPLSYDDYYLGIPFTRDIKLYGEIILNEFNTKNNINFSWNKMHDILKYKDSKYYSKVFGFLNYKLNPFLDNTDNIFESNTDMIVAFIKKNYYVDNNYYLLALAGAFLSYSLGYFVNNFLTH